MRHRGWKELMPPAGEDDLWFGGLGVLELEVSGGALVGVGVGFEGLEVWGWGLGFLFGLGLAVGAWG